MEFRSFEVIQGNKVFRIEEDYPDVGAYLYVIENGHCTYDYLQDNVEECKLFAFEEFRIPLDSWKFNNQIGVSSESGK